LIEEKNREAVKEKMKTSKEEKNHHGGTISSLFGAAVLPAGELGAAIDPCM
jgi:hypothetical protein